MSGPVVKASDILGRELGARAANDAAEAAAAALDFDLGLLLVNDPHKTAEDNAALLIFPEGTCVNNEYCIQFKKGAFELGAIIYPVAIKYNRIFCDAFWNSRKQSFVRHIYNLMTSWALVADVWYLDPQVIQPGETSVQFAARVKAMIAKKAGLVNVSWDGYLKYFKPNDKLVQDCKRHFADELRAKLQFRVDNPGVLCSGPPSPPIFRRRIL